MKFRATILSLFALAACGRADAPSGHSSGSAPGSSGPTAATGVDGGAQAVTAQKTEEDAASAAAAVDAATEAPARGAGLRLGFAFTVNQMGELEPCG